MANDTDLSNIGLPKRLPGKSPVKSIVYAAALFGILVTFTALVTLASIPAVKSADVDPALDAQVKFFGWGMSIIVLNQGNLSDEQKAQIMSEAKASGFKVVHDYNIIDGFSGVITSKSLEQLKQREGVSFIQLDRVYNIPPLPTAPKENRTGSNGSQGGAGIQLDVSVISAGASQAWGQFNVTGKGIKVAVIDTGINYSHVNLGGCFGAGCRVVSGYDFANNDNDPMDDHGHGTHVAGIVGANGSVTGVAPNVTFFAYKACNSGGSCSNSAVVSAIDAAVSNGSQVIHMSLGGWNVPWATKDAMTLAAENAVRRNITVVISAGNNGQGQAQAIGTITSPALGEGIISVAAADDKGTVNISDDDIASFSSRGPSPFGRFGPSLSAPGVSITSTWNNGGTNTISGTSMAAPHVSGAAALIIERFGNLTPQQIASKLMHSAQNISQNPFDEGAGEINVTRALSMRFDALANGNPALEAIVIANTTGEFNVTISSLGPGLSYNFSVESILDQRLAFTLPKTIVSFPAEANVSASSNASFSINISMPEGANASIYQSIIIITSNESDFIRLPVAITVPAYRSAYFLRAVDNPPRNYQKGDIIYYLTTHIINSTFIGKINWSGSSSTEDLDLYVFNATQVGTVLSGNADTLQESVSFFNPTNMTWFTVHVYDSNVHPVTVAVNMSANAVPVLEQPANISTGDFVKLVVNLSATDPDSTVINYTLNDTNFTKTTNTTFEWNIPVGFNKTRYLTASVTDFTTTASRQFAVFVTAVNQLPNATNIAIVPSEPSAATNAKCNYTYTDPNSDAENGTIIKWFFNGVENATYRNQSTLNGTQVVRNVSLKCEVSVSDGINRSLPINASAVTTVNAIPLVSLCNFTFNASINSGSATSWRICSANYSVEILAAENGTRANVSVNGIFYSLQQGQSGVFDNAFSNFNITVASAYNDSNTSALKANVTARILSKQIFVRENQSAEINLTVSDAEGDVITFNYSYPFNSSAWIPAANQTGTYIVNVTITDGWNITTRNINVTVAKALKSQNISLTVGWNLFSIPYDAVNSSPAAVVEQLKSNYTSLWTYNMTNSTWQYFLPSNSSGTGSGTLNAVVPGLGYWINMNNSMTLQINGTEPASNVTALYAGWNLVGVKSASGLLLSSIAGVQTQNTTVWGYNAVWQSYQPNGLSRLNTLKSFSGGQGYWIYVDSAGNWTI